MNFLSIQGFICIGDIVFFAFYSEPAKRGYGFDFSKIDFSVKIRKCY